MPRLVVLLVGALFFASPRAVDADTILVFGQSTGLNLFTGDETAGTTVLDATNLPVTLTALNSTGVNLGAFFNFDATSTALATNVTGNAWLQPYTGDFSVTSGLGGTGFNYLSGSFDGVQLGLLGGRTFVFGVSEPPLSVDFTSDVPGMPLDLPRAFALSLTNVFPGVDLSNGSFADFSSNVSGTASAAPPIPEPGSMLLLGSGLVGLVVARRKKKRGV